MLTPTRTNAQRLLLLVAGLAFAATACSGGSGQSFGTSTSAQHTTTTERSSSSGSAKIRWHGCGSYRCGTLRVPVDYAHPHGPTLQLALVDLPAEGHSKGPLLVNPGGPGASGIELATQNPWSSAIRRNFDIIGFDPRGVGKSSPIHCGLSGERLYHVDYVPDTPAETNALISVSKRYVDDCATKYRSLLAHIGTRDVARDMDQIRKALGVAKLSYLGYSYGTAIGQAYADLFPTHIRAMVLDGIVDLAQSGIASAQGQGLSFDHLVDLFEKWCSSHDDCAIHDDPKGVLQSVLEKTQRGTIAAPDADRPLGPGEFQLGIIDPLYQGESGYSDLAQALSDADQGDGSAMVSLADDYLSSGSLEIYFAVSCLDQSWPHDPQAVIAAGRAIASRAPVTGEATVTDYIRCALWPVPPQPLGATKAPGSPPILIVSTTDDPATPYANGEKLAKELPHGVLLTHVGSGHTIYGQGDSCIDDAVDTYLVTLRTPRTGARCD